MTLYAAPSPPVPVFRVARGEAGPPSDPFASPGWERVGPDGTFGNRFDDPSKVDGRPDEARFRMIYAATQREAAFAETIAHFRPDLPALAALSAIHGGASEPQPLTGVVPVRWQQLRGIGRLLLDSALRFVDVAHPDTLAEMRATFARLAGDLGHRDIAVSTLTSGDRRLTQRIARCLRADGCDRSADWADPNTGFADAARRDEGQRTDASGTAENHHSARRGFPSTACYRIRNLMRLFASS